MDENESQWDLWLEDMQQQALQRIPNENDGEICG